jgi:hypothetical protein
MIFLIFLESDYVCFCVDPSGFDPFYKIDKQSHFSTINLYSDTSQT